MCGLVGVYSKELDDKMKKAFCDMLVIDAVRGEDSTGVAIGKVPILLNQSIDYEVKKTVGNPFDFFIEHSYAVKSRTLTHSRCNVMLGHNRAATIGKVVVANAHPFEYQHVIGAHNGTVSFISLKDFDGYDAYEVDSQIIYQQLNNHGLEAVWDKADGAMALSWIDKRDDSLNLCRNSERSLFYAKTKDGKGMLWASEMIFIYLGAFRHGIKIEDPEEVKTNLHHKFTYDKYGTLVLETKELKPFVRVIPPFRQQGWAAGWYGDDENYYQQSKTPEQKRKETKSETTAMTFQILEIHKQDNYCFAIGEDEESKEKVRVFIPTMKLDEAEKKITGRGKTAGYYTTGSARPSNFQGCKWFVNWTDVHWVKYKTDKDNVVEFDYSTAPWFESSQRLSKEAYMTRTECGCDNCKGPVTWENRNEILWVNKNDFYCGVCKEDPIVKDWIQSMYGQARA